MLLCWASTLSVSKHFGQFVQWHGASGSTVRVCKGVCVLAKQNSLRVQAGVSSVLICVLCRWLTTHSLNWTPRTSGESKPGRPGAPSCLQCSRDGWNEEISSSAGGVCVLSWREMIYSGGEISVGAGRTQRRGQWHYSESRTLNNGRHSAAFTSSFQ